MVDLIKLLLPFFHTPKSFGQVLTKLASFAFYETYIITLFLRSNPTLDTFFGRIESWGPIGKVVSIIPHHEALNLSGVVIAFSIAILTHMFQFHDQVSDLFGIRRRFDRKQILIPLAQRVGSKITKDKKLQIAAKRDKLMHTVFYKYASSRAENPLVDKHDIEHALNAWSWFWVLVEAVAYFGVGTCIAWVMDSNDLASNFAICSGIFLFLAVLQSRNLKRYARPQIDRIAADSAAAAEIKRIFDAL